MQIISIGEILWDVFADKEFLGGAALNFSAAAKRLGNKVALLTGVGQDERGDRALEGMRSLHLDASFVQRVPGQTTGTAIVVMDHAGDPGYVIARPVAFDSLQADDLLLTRLADLRPDWIYFGTLAQTCSVNEAIVRELLRRKPSARTFYDLNLRTGHWDLALVERLCAITTVLKLNRAEAELLFRLSIDAEGFTLERFCELWSANYRIETIVITLGGEGCAVFTGGTLQTYKGFVVAVADAVGAGDAFTAGFLHGYHNQWPTSQTARFANALGSIVASRAGATPDWTVQECLDVAGLPFGGAELEGLTSVGL